ncbi:MAG: CPBP family intramembrane metalloprotease [Planctomycetes bacterium]|nr:CPBP family intramembrane metalloprotease [Planctomycetota bacterium]
MNGRPRPPALIPLLQLAAVAAVAALAFGGHGAVGWPAPAVGLPALALLAVVWPPAVRWLPLRWARVLGVYAAFGPGWLLFVFGYLRGLRALGVVVQPQPSLLRLAERGAELPELAALVAGIVLVAPLLEEIVFRGYLFTALDRVLPRPSVHLLTAAAFGLVHGPHYALPIGVLALLFGWLRARHDSLSPAALAHAVHNALTVAAVLLWPGCLDLLYAR